ncbi:four helix bundle protein [Robertkochia flava]|uniref:four helix bundle protein n=1 Tax=Robertkochia flava TaxID=3447986 RepID=UPI001CCC4F0E|nr:four helix bundle protein [Robertkochia marina]
MKEPLKIKSYEFSILIVGCCDTLQLKREYILSKQLLKSGTAICALYREAQYAESRADFIHKLAIAQKECNETIYWLELCRDSGKVDQEHSTCLIFKATELLKIITSIIRSSKKKLNTNN